MRVFASVPEITVKKRGEKTKEVYLISFASDLAGSKDRPLALGASNETLDWIVPEIKAAMKYFVVSASNVFHGIREDQPVSLTGSGIIVYPPMDPRGMLALHVALVESDGGKRRAGGALKEVFRETAVGNLLKEFPKFARTKIPATLLTSIFAAITSVLPDVLGRNRDDILFEHGHSGFDFDDYGMSPDREDYQLGNDRAGFRLRIRTLDKTRNRA